MTGLLIILSIIAFGPIVFGAVVMLGYDVKYHGLTWDWDVVKGLGFLLAALILISLVAGLVA